LGAALAGALLGVMRGMDKGEPFAGLMWLAAEGGFYGAVLVLMVTAYLRNTRREPLRSALVGDFPVVTWEEDCRQGGLLNLSYQYKRRCGIEVGSDGTLLFVHEALEDGSAGWMPWAGLVGKEVARLAGLNQRVSHSERRPWAMLQGFVITDDVAWFGVRTAGGDAPKERYAVILADFGAEGGRIAVSYSISPPNVVSLRHDILLREFLMRRERAVLHHTIRQARGEVLGKGPPQSGPNGVPESID
jgi:hypothetical protein